MGLANWLTLLRILLIPVFVTLLVYRRPGPALIVFAVAALTDLLDGWAARHWKDESSLGAFLDPMADKLLLTSSFVTLTYLKALPFWIAAVVISRDTILVFGALLIYMLAGRSRPRSRRSDRGRQRSSPARRDRLSVPHRRRAARADGRARRRHGGEAAAAQRGRTRPRAGGAAPGRHRDVREQVRVLLHPPASHGHAQESLRERRRLQAVVPARQLHHAQRPRRSLVRADHRAASLAALHLRLRYRPGATARLARPPATLGRDPAAPRAAGEGRDPDARADRPMPRPQRRNPSRAHRVRAGAAPSARRDDRGRSSRAHAASGATPGAAKPHGRRGASARRDRRGLAASMARRAR